jgi:hypothetical protein
VVGRVYNGVLEAAGVREVQVELAVLGFVGCFASWANVRLKLVKAVASARQL